ncbi:NAD-dependent epimerase/dehydratase family protein [Priestia megaterium]|uniref:NAD-dependent epimerase/dehydratase family protein n=1 Tax=Priestia megaterium TaxID=1404 RepID=UPI00203FD9A7|nr:NAD-dependent epimerase/dehydratase family protein [Priestia megaterium]MCM3197155.1 NAD-dependent epimerase/dehydratase family protein [Priestia megaterium]
MNQQRSLLLTGASGFTGRHACNYFNKAGFNVTAVARENFNISNGNINIESCNLTNKDDVNKLVKKVKPQYLLHLAGQNHVGKSWSDPVSTLETNSMSTAYLIDALREENPSCKIVIVGSALQFNPNDASTVPHPYSLSKTLQVIIAQSWATLYNMHVTIAKPSNLIGPGFSNGVCSIFAKKIVEMEENKVEKVLNVHNLNAQRDFIDVRDAVIAYETLLLKGKANEVYDIASGNSYSVQELANKFKEITNVDFEIKSQLINQIEPKVEIIPSKIISLGWQQTISLEQSLKDILNFSRENR